MRGGGTTRKDTKDNKDGSGRQKKEEGTRNRSGNDNEKGEGIIRS